MKIGQFAITALVATCLAVPVVAQQTQRDVAAAPIPTIADDTKRLKLTDNYLNAYDLVVERTGPNPAQGVITGRLIACRGSGRSVSYPVDGTFLGTTVTMNVYAAGGSCGPNLDSFIFCIWYSATKVCSGTQTTADGGNPQPIIIVKEQ